jgi:hypothetical protein
VPDEPFVVGFDREHRDQPDQDGHREDADDVGPAADLAVEALQRVGRLAGQLRVRARDRVDV